ncbi:MAG TPA: PGPGW domain-containing protein [Candidatus Eisenbacteria bacterium]|nr:PGPGW domain-containing protein [Candidatus Eisenbacteria bacterium]
MSGRRRQGDTPENSSRGTRHFIKRLFGRYETARKIVVGILGASVLLLGALMLFLPGPAIIVIPAGLALLATEFGWARAILRKLKRRLGASDNSSARANR